MQEDIVIVSGPVIIENNKVLLNREIKKRAIESPFFMFPGGKLKHMDEDPQEACLREVQEELGIAIDIIRPLEPLIEKRPDAAEGYAILLHYLAKRRHPDKQLQPPTQATVEWGWFDIHNLPKNCTPNVAKVISHYLNEQTL